MSSYSGDNRPFVFRDPGGKRWPRLRRRLVLIGIVLFLGFVLFVQTLFVRPELALPLNVRRLKGQLKALEQDPAQSLKPAPSWQKHVPTSIAMQERLAKLRQDVSPQPKAPTEIRLGFYVDWDPSCFQTLEQHAGELTHVAPERFTLIDGLGNLRVQDDVRLQRFAASRGLVLMPLLSNLVDDIWQPEAAEGLINGPSERRDKFIINLLNELDKAKAGGVIIDFEQIDPSFKQNSTAFLEQMAKALHSVHKQLWMLMPMGDEIESYDLERLSSSIDRFVAVLHDENSDTDEPGPIASEDWFEGWLQVVTAYGKPSQWIATIGVYGYDWCSGQKRADTISFADAMSRASYAGIDKVETKAPEYNPGYSYEDSQGKHSVVFLDAVTFLNQLRAVREAKLGGVGISRLGMEDPHIWEVLKMQHIANPSPDALNRIKVMKSSDTITNVGNGEIVTVDDTQDDGIRQIELDSNFRFTGLYKADSDPKRGFPTYPILYHQGAGDPHAVALTFDDGPDPKWTPYVLDILKARGVKATFFVLGSQAEKYPGLIKRIVNEGHELGNHTYTHSNLATDSNKQITLELNATQRLIESITGRSMTLFRPPYNADSHPSKMEELLPLKLVQDDLGYLVVLENIDPEDWSTPGTEAILQRIKDQRKNGNIVLLHDAGGDRTQTVEALPKIIDYLHARGDRVVAMSELLHIPHDEIMPLVTNADPYFRFVAAAGFGVVHTLQEFLWAFMIVATGLILVRTVVVAILASKHHRDFCKPETATFHPPLSIVIAAYNEAKVIGATIRSVVDTDYPGPIELIVVDDGSKDQTSEEIRKLAFVDPRIHLLQQTNKGKSAALSAGVAKAKHEILVFLDADTHFDRSTLTQLVQPLEEEKVGAVSGHAKVGNLRSFMARCQALEYTCGFNLDRRAYTTWNCITVAPGAISALRRSALEKVGGFSEDTLAEDTDLTLSLHKEGYRIEYSPHAIAWTEAPETMATLAKQRFRWAFGTLQCLWKHRDLTFNPDFKALGWFSLPNIWFFQIILVAITPAIDFLVILSLVTGVAMGLLNYFLLFLFADLLLAVLACWLDGEKIRKAWLMIPMRLIYRPLLSYVIWGAIYRAVSGVLVTWGKLERTASVTPPVHEINAK